LQNPLTSLQPKQFAVQQFEFEQPLHWAGLSLHLRPLSLLISIDTVSPSIISLTKHCGL